MCTVYFRVHTEIPFHNNFISLLHSRTIWYCMPRWKVRAVCSTQIDNYENWKENLHGLEKWFQRKMLQITYARIRAVLCVRWIPRDRWCSDLHLCSWTRLHVEKNTRSTHTSLTFVRGLRDCYICIHLICHLLVARGAYWSCTLYTA